MLPRQFLGSVFARTRTASVRGHLDTRATARRVFATGGARTRSFGPVNQIQNPILNRRLADRLQMKETSPIPTVGTELQPVIVVDDITDRGREDTVKRYMIGLGMNAGAGNIPCFQVFNPLTSQITVHPKRIIVSTDAGGITDSFFVQIGIIQLAAGLTGHGLLLNSRPNPNSGLSTALVGNNAQAGAPGGFTILSFYQKDFTAGSEFAFESMVLYPGQALTVFSLVAASGAEVTFDWVEEPLIS